jgi:hypothetical protein
VSFPKLIDIASYQPEAFSTAGIDGVFVKATESTGYVNPRYAAQIAHARAAKLVVGHYHFLHHGSASAEAAYFVHHADVRPGEIIACDWEYASSTQADRDAWMKAVKAAFPHNRVILYCNKSFWRNRDTESYAGDGLWIADPDSPAGKPGISAPWVFHQYSEAGGVDHDVANFDSPAALRSWASGGAVVNIPATPPATTTKGTPAVSASAEEVWAYSHGDKPDVHQTLEDAARYAKLAADNSAKAAAPVLTDAQAEAIAQRVVALLVARLAS